MTRGETIDIFTECIKMPQEKRDAIIDSGMFNSIIEGYLVLTLREMGKSEEEQITAQHTLKKLFDYVRAEEARKEA